MPPPRLPKNAGALASIVGSTVVEITNRQGTGVSTSDCIRGVHQAMKNGLSVVGFDLPQLVADAAHNGPNAWEMGHKDRFCKACAAIYLAVNEAIAKNNEIEDYNER